jgi:hypothetical protein
MENFIAGTYDLPKNIGFSKKKIYKNISVYIAFILFAAWGFWYGTGKFFTEDYYYPSITIMMPVAGIVLLILIIQQILLLRKNELILILTKEGLYCNAKGFTDLGMIKWEDITRCFSSSERMYGSVNINIMLQIHVQNSDTYLNRISDMNKRKKIIKQSAKKHENALLWVNTANLDCDMNELKKTIFQFINQNQ